MMDFISSGPKQIAKMCEELGIASPEVLFDQIPPPLLHKDDPLSKGMSEQEAYRLFEKIAKKSSCGTMTSYLGAGSYFHYIPAALSFITQNSAFLTAYTPYQAEASQGMLQAIFEFQTALATLTGMEVANASMYDGASALGEAILMAARIEPEKKSVYLHPSLPPRVVEAAKNHCLSKSIRFSSKRDEENLLAYLFACPAFSGSIAYPHEDIVAAKAKGAIAISYGNPLAYALFAPPGEMGADIATGDLQPLGIPLQFGGPYCGYMATTKRYIRQLPGRMVGETKDIEGKRAFTLILQAREQHIRREKALSNICTNQALSALSAWLFMSGYGKKGLPALALDNWRRQAFLRSRLQEIRGLIIDDLPVFNEFIVRSEKSIDPWIALGKREGVLIGYKIDEKSLLVSVTETKTKEDLLLYVDLAKKAYHDR